MRSVEAAARNTGPSFRAMCVLGWHGNHIMLAGGYTTLVPDEMAYDSIRVLDDEWICAILDDDEPASAAATATATAMGSAGDSGAAASGSGTTTSSGAGSGSGVRSPVGLGDTARPPQPQPQPQLSSAVDPISRLNPNKSTLSTFFVSVDDVLVSGWVSRGSLVYLSLLF